MNIIPSIANCCFTAIIAGIRTTLETKTVVAAIYLHNLTTILADKSSFFRPGQLNYSIPSEPATVHDLLIQKSSGTFDLVLWDERVTGSDQVTLDLGGQHKSVTLYDPTVGTGASQPLRNVSSVVMTLSNHPVVIEIPLD